MVDQDNQPPANASGHTSEGPDAAKLGAKAEAQVFATIVRYLAERLTDVEPDVDPGDLVATGELFVEIAEAFENTSGFEFSSDQALPLSHAFAMLEGGMRILAEQAHETGHTNAAAKMEWAALKARTMTATLETHHLEQSHGIIAFDLEDDADNDNGASD